MRRLIAIAVLGSVLAAPARADFIASGFFASGFVVDGFFVADGGSPQVTVPNVVGEADFAAADAILEAASLDAGTETEQCSAAPDNEVIGQNPIAGATVSTGTLVDLTTSNGVACPSATRRPSIQIGIGIGVTQ
jgi:beta-lactam-binding protein with PASTA domain